MYVKIHPQKGNIRLPYDDLFTNICITHKLYMQW